MTAIVRVVDEEQRLAAGRLVGEYQRGVELLMAGTDVSP